MNATLESRYRRLLLLYPTEYRAAREDEMVGTYLATAERLRLVDVVDVVRGAARQRVRANAATVGDTRNTAATLALAAAVALAAIWFTTVELAVLDSGPAGLWVPGVRRVGPFTTLGVVVWSAWLVTGLLGLAGRARAATLVSLGLTVAVVPAAAITGIDRPSLLTLVPQAALGVVAAAWPVRPQWTARTFVLGSGVVAAVFGGARLRSGLGSGYYFGTSDILFTVAGCLLVCAFVSAVPGLLRGSSRSLLVLPILAVPAALLMLNRITSRLVGDGYGAPTEAMPALALFGAAILVLATVGYVAARGYQRRIRGRSAHGS